MKIFFGIISVMVCAVVLSFTIGAFYAYYYPMKFKDEIKEYSKEYEIEGAWIASVANVESGFRENVTSSKGAVGIMQIMPSTAEWVAGQIKEEYDYEMLYNGKYNLKLGSYYLAYLMKYFNDSKTALSAYNAGQGNVINWLNDKKYSDDGKTLKNIPFNETKKYINKVFKNYKYYKNRYK